MGLRCKKALIVFIEVTVRSYSTDDLVQLIEVYKSAFAEPPWNEYLKCVSCKVEYDKQEVKTLCKGGLCKKCNQPLTLDKFPFLNGKVSIEASYMDEIAVRGDGRLRGIGTLLGENYIEAVRQQRLSEVVLRTDERNISSMSLFRKLGFLTIPNAEDQRRVFYDPQFPNRIYLRKEV